MTVLPVILCAVLVAASPSAFAGRPAAPIEEPQFRARSFPVIDLPWERLPYNDEPIGPVPRAMDLDPPRSVLYPEDGSHYARPAGYAQRVVRYLDAYRRTGVIEYLRAARAAAYRFRLLATRVGPADFLPYWNGFDLHGNATLALEPPWYSGMAQGLVLSVDIRLYELTGDPYALAAAHRVFASVAATGPQAAPWVTWIDRDGYVWVEEYPSSHPVRTLNGFVFGLFGVYDYWRVTRNGSARMLLDGLLTTLRHYVGDYRNAGQASDYCLAHRRRSLSYHRLHVHLLREVAALSGDPYFARMAELFEADRA